MKGEARPGSNGRPRLYDEQGDPFKIIVSAGLCEPKHLAAIGPALGLYLLLLRGQTDDDGNVLHGRQIKVNEIACWLGTSQNTARRMLHRLRDCRYVSLHDGQHGQSVRVLKAKPKSRPWNKGLALPEVQAPPPKTGSPPSQHWEPPLPDLESKHYLEPVLLAGASSQCNTTPSPAKRSASRLTAKDFEAGNEAQIARLKALMERYDADTRSAIHDGMNRCRNSRKTKTLARTISIAVLESLAKYDAQYVLKGTIGFLNQDRSLHKPEAYWLGCVRSAAKEGERDG